LHNSIGMTAGNGLCKYASKCISRHACACAGVRARCSSCATGLGSISRRRCPPTIYSFLCSQPVSEWTSLNVVEWMSALNLYRYADVFKSKDIKGSDLLHLDREKLMVSRSFQLYVQLSCRVSRTSRTSRCRSLTNYDWTDDESRFVARRLSSFGFCFGNLDERVVVRFNGSL